MIEIRLPDLSRVAMEPGDVLVVRVPVPRQLSVADAKAIRERMRTHFPDNDVVVLSAGVELAVVRPTPSERFEPTADVALYGVCDSGHPRSVRTTQDLYCPACERAAALPPPAALAQLFAEANDRPDHVGPAASRARAVVRRGQRPARPRGPGMTQHLQTVPAGLGPTEEHIRVLEAYRREFAIPISLPYSTAAFNRAIDWWNAGCPSASTTPANRIGDSIIRYLAGQPPFAGDPNNPEPRDLWVCRTGEYFRIQQPIAERIIAGLDLLNAELFGPSQVSFADGVFRIVDSAGFVVLLRPLGVDLDRREVVFERVDASSAEPICIPPIQLPRDDVATPREGDPHAP